MPSCCIAPLRMYFAMPSSKPRPAVRLFLKPIAMSPVKCSGCRYSIAVRAFPKQSLSKYLSPLCAAGRTDGHGLGLAIAYRVVAAHHGLISARNRLEGGLCVEILLPLQGGS